MDKLVRAVLAGFLIINQSGVLVMDIDDKKIWKAAIYVRLSRDDGDKAESESVKNQKDLIRSYINGRPDMIEAGVYEDDGFSGVNMDRPGFQRMMADIRDNKINAVVVKDLSRLGRNYIETGKLLESLFPFMRVRCVAITDNYDSAKQNNQSDSLIIPFKNLINDAFLADTSRKVRSQLDIKRKKGDYIGSFSNYGYKKDPLNHNKLVIDEAIAPVIQDIFRWKIEGMSQDAIAKRLNASGSPAPLEYKKLIGCKYSTPFTSKERSVWTAVTVGRILKNSLYIGTLTQGVMTTPNYKVKSRLKKPPEEWASVPQAHEGIISREDFSLVESLMKRDTRIAPGRDKVYMLSGWRVSNIVDKQ